MVFVMKIMMDVMLNLIIFDNMHVDYQRNGKSLSWGFVEFHDPESASQCVLEVRVSV